MQPTLLSFQDSVPYSENVTSTFVSGAWPGDPSEANTGQHEAPSADTPMRTRFLSPDFCLGWSKGSVAPTSSGKGDDGRSFLTRL